jgi:hypothetical protein
MGERQNRIEELKRSWRLANFAWAACLCAGFALAYALAMLDSTWGAIAAFSAGLLGGSWWRRQAARAEREIFMAEIDDLEALLEVERQEIVESELARQRMIAGIAFDTPAGMLDGAPLYQFATRSGLRYEYHGLATKTDVPSEKLLIVNGVAYKLMT